MGKSTLLSYVLISMVLICFGCRSKFAKTRKKGSFDEKFEAAVKYYDKKDYYHASILFEDLLPLANGKKNADKIELYYAYTQFYEKQYIVSSYYFKRYYETYTRSEKVQEAMYMRGVCLYKISPKSTLDQQSTEKAIIAFQNYINKYPYSEYASEVNQKIDELQEKLELKAYTNTKLYHKVERYKASVVAVDNFKIDFPDSHYNEELQFLKVESQYKLGKESHEMVTDDEGNIIHLKRERLKTAENFYFDYVDNYSNGEFAKQAEYIYTNIKELLNQVE